MTVLVRITIPVVLHFLSKHRRKPRVIAVVNLEDCRILWWHLTTQELVNRISLVLGIPAKPQLRVRFTDCRTQQVKTGLGQRLCFLDPRTIKPFKRLDTVSSMVLHTLKDNHAIATLGLNHHILDCEVILHFQFNNLVLKQPFDRLVQRSLYLSDADTSLVLIANVLLNEQLCKEMRFT